MAYKIDDQIYYLIADWVMYVNSHGSLSTMPYLNAHSTNTTERYASDLLLKNFIRQSKQWYCKLGYFKFAGAQQKSAPSETLI